MTEPEQWAVDAWERYGPKIFNCEITGPEALQLVVEDQMRKLREVLEYIASEAASAVSSYGEVDVHAFERIEKNARQARK